MKRPAVLVCAFTLLLAACAQQDEVSPHGVSVPTPSPIPTPIAMELTSPAFTHGGAIPSRYTCDGEDLSPPLRISGIPEGTQSLALICDDPDAPGNTWNYWILFNIDPATTEITEGTEPPESAGGTNSWRRIGYGGPCPPSGTHRYFFKLFALDAPLPRFDDPPTKQELSSAMEGHILKQAELMGVYQR